MLEYKFEKIGFIGGVFAITRSKLFLIAIGSLLALIATGDLTRVIFATSLVAILIIWGAWQANTYFIQYLKIDEEGIGFVVFRYGRIFLEKRFDFSDVTFDIQVASASIRGTTYKMVINANGSKISQYAINGWKEEDFYKIINCSSIQTVSKNK